jgi:hypothetical protein
VLGEVGSLLAETCSRGLLIRDLGPVKIGVVKRGDVGFRVYWHGVEGQASRRALPRHVQVWLLGRLDEGLRSDPDVSRLDRARVWQAFCRRAGWRSKDERRSLRVDR